LRSFEELRGHLFLMMTAEGHDHPPMSVLKITLPRAAAFRLQQRFLRLAERVQIRVAGNHNFVGIRQRVARPRGQHQADQVAVRVGVGNGLGGIKPCVLEELPRRARHDEAMVRVIRLGQARAVFPFSLRVKIIFPDEIVRVGECVGLEVERPSCLRRVRMGCCATAQRQRHCGQARIKPAPRRRGTVVFDFNSFACGDASHKILPANLTVRYQTDHALRPMAANRP